MIKSVAISGSTGFIGNALYEYFSSLGLTVIRITRSDLYKNQDELQRKISLSDAVVNFAGYSIFKKWSKHNRKKILNSRVHSTKVLVSVLNEHFTDKHLLNASAIGIYDTINCHDENNFYYGNDFLADVVKNWEEEASQLVNNKLTIIRLGIVLGKEGGAFPNVLLPSKFGIGIIPGKGSQYFSFIHIYDVLASIKFLIDKKLEGIYNLTSPTPITYKDFVNTFSNYRRFFLSISIPSFLIKGILGKASTLLLDGQNVIPTNLLQQGFTFKYTDIYLTTNDLLNK